MPVETATSRSHTQLLVDSPYRWADELPVGRTAERDQAA